MAIKFDKILGKLRESDSSSPDLTSISGNILNTGYLRVGSTTAPANTTAGDATILRLSIGNNTLSSTGGAIIAASGTMTDTEASAVYFSNFANTIQPSSNSSSEFRALNFTNVTSPLDGVTLTTVLGGYFENRVRSTGTITNTTGIEADGFKTDSSSGATAIATNIRGVNASVYNRPSGTTTTTSTTAVGYDTNSWCGNGALTVTDLVGSRVQNPGTGHTITNLYGYFVSQFNRASTSNFGAYITPPALANGIGNTTNSIALNIPTSTCAMGNTTNTTTNAHGISIGKATYNSTTNTRTITNAASLYINDAPVAGTNVSITNGPYALWVDAGTIRFDGDLILNGAAEAADHGTADVDQLVNVCYGTGDPPVASTTTEGALYIKYTA